MTLTLLGTLHTRLHLPMQLLHVRMTNRDYAHTRETDTWNADDTFAWARDTTRTSPFETGREPEPPDLPTTDDHLLTSFNAVLALSLKRG